jgi:MoaA/NifB/PqqE/SkfB family radical SAM enzyme
MPAITLKETLESYGLKKIIAYLDSNPVENIPRLLAWGERIDREGMVAPQLKAIKSALRDKDGNWYRLVRSFWTDIDDRVRKTLFENFVINGAVVGSSRQFRAKKTYGCNIPWAILLDPTSDCNLKCKGCWAADYGNHLQMDVATLDKIINQGKALGIFIYIYSGGEPLIRKSDIIRLCEKHHECIFSAFTNGTLIDEPFADEMLRVGNFVPAISVEGTEEATDARRGQGTYQKLIKAMGILKRKRLLFGFSSCYTRQNPAVIGSEEYFDTLIAMGAKFGWLFTYMPVGMDAIPELMVTPEQREYMYRQVKQFRNTKPIFVMDFWNDGEYKNGCIAGGKSYLHINANGDIEPCAFIHYSDTNIRDKTLLEGLQGALFQQYKQNQPFNENHLRPCPLLDNPARLDAMVKASGARSTEMLSPEDVGHLCQKCELASEKWAVTADRLWSETDKNKEPVEINK